MITASDTQDFVPFGREYVQQHPGKFQIQVQNVVHTDPGLHFLKSFRDISLQDTGKKEQWTLYSQKDEESGRGSYDEELYVNGNTVVWSRGGQDGYRNVVKTFTMDTPVLQALWCNFVIPESSNPDEICSTLDTKGEILSGVCVVESSCVSCFINDGSDYLAALPFQVAHAWVIKNGLLFERMVSPNEYSLQKRDAPNQTTVFSMLHPLDEVAPVITKTGTAGSQKISYLTDNTQHVVFSSVDLSIVLTYDTMVGVHSAWKVRRARQEECGAVCNNWDQTNSVYQMGPSTPAHNLNQSSSNMSRFFGNMSAAQSPQVSPLRYSGRISSPAFLSHSQSPLTSNPGIDRRSQSPAMFGSNSLYRLNTPSPQTSKSPGNFYRTPANMSLINESFTDWTEPINPEICLEHIWTETAPAIRDGSLGKSSKAFLTRDLCGQQYLCYVISYRQQLRCVKFEESNDLKKLVFGTVNVIPCKDAVPVESKDLLIVLDTSGCLYVYSGITKLNRLYVPALPMGNMSMSMLRQMTPLQSPVRGGVFTSSRPPSAMDAMFDEEFQLNQISPVPTELEESSNFDELPLGCSYIQCLRDNIADRFTIELTNGHLFRCTVPDMTNLPGIDLCLKALKHMLPRDTALQMTGRWYTERNSPGGVGSHREWLMFIRSLLTMMGYDTSRLPLTYRQELDMSLSPVSAKKAKTTDQGSDEDWESMLNADHHKFAVENLDDVLGLINCQSAQDSKKCSQQAIINTGAMLFNHIPACFMALHLVYEELKLNTLLIEDLEQLVTVVHQLALDLRCDEYVDYYRRDFTKLNQFKSGVSQVKEDYLEKMQYPSLFTKKPLSIFNWILKSLEGQKTGAFMYIPLVCNNIQNVISLYALLLNKHMSTDLAVEKCLRKVPPSGHRAPTCDISMSRSFCSASPTHNHLERTVLYMTQLGMTESDLMYLPVGVVLPIREAMFHCRCNPPSDWPEEAYTLIGREDISKLLSLQDKNDVSPPPGIFKRKPSPQSQGTKEEDDGMEHLDDEYLRLRFSEDLRVQEARRLLQSSRPARIALVQKPEISDHDFIEEQERHLYSICIRTMALSVGRGMFTLSTYHPLPTETLPIPKLCLTGKAPPRNTTVDLSHIDTVPNMTAWPLFHNGVAAGLRIVDFSQVDSSWIMYNRPKSNELTNEFAGFLMALGLNKHLVKMHILNKHDYLSKEHEMTTIGLLLGVAAAKRSSMDLATLKMLSVHLPAMLPPTSTELNVSHNVQVAAILGVGLVFQGTGHRHTADIMLAEIGRPPGPELQNCKDRESYSLAAGLALGLVMFGKGKETMGTSDLSMALYHCMVGGQKRPLVGPSQERYKTPSYQIQEGDTVNVDVTSPGATLALGMLYFNTKNSAVSEWLKVPDTQFMLDQVRPDFLLLRTLARGLVMWDYVLPSMDFIKQTMPKILTDYAFHKYQSQEEDDDDHTVDYETLSQAYCHVVAGACMVIGLKFAGSASEVAFTTLMKCMNEALRIVSSPSLVEQAGKSTVENCVITILLSMGMVMAGTGNLDVLRLCRMLRSRVGPPYNQFVMYGSHMAISMAVGLLFLGGGKYTLSTKDEAIAVMLCAFFPKFPTHSNDNRYHLQAFRHLYVLAAELRTTLPRDVDTGFPCYVPVEIRFMDSRHYRNESYQSTAPCTLPELDLLQQIKILGPRYWPIVFDRDKNWDSLKALLRHNGMLYVKQRAGHLSYVEDPKGYRSMLAKSFTVDQSSQTCIKPDVIKAFTSDAKVVALTEHFFNNQDDSPEDLLQVLSDVLYECVTLEKPEAISTHIMLDQITRRSEFQLTSLGVSQLKLIYAYYNLEHSSATGSDMLEQSSLHEEFQGQQLLKPEFLLAMSNRLKSVFDKWLEDNVTMLVHYLKGESIEQNDSKHLSSILTWYDIPSPSQLAHISITGVPSLPALYNVLPHLRVSTLMMLLKVWKTSG